jgi:hypothetical protein
VEDTCPGAINATIYQNFSLPVLVDNVNEAPLHTGPTVIRCGPPPTLRLSLAAAPCVCLL